MGVRAAAASWGGGCPGAVRRLRLGDGPQRRAAREGRRARAACWRLRSRSPAGSPAPSSRALEGLFLWEIGLV